jgi:hypothetical protein
MALALACALLSSCGEGGPEGSEETPAVEAPAPAEPPRDPATVRSITPTSGVPGTEVTLRAGGLPPETDMEIGFGAPNTNFEILVQVRTDRDGELVTTLDIPAWAEPGRGYMFVVAPVNQPPRAASDTFRVTAPAPR